MFASLIYLRTSVKLRSVMNRPLKSSNVRMAKCTTSKSHVRLVLWNALTWYILRNIFQHMSQDNVSQKISFVVCSALFFIYLFIWEQVLIMFSIEAAFKIIGRYRMSLEFFIFSDFMFKFLYLFRFNFFCGGRSENWCQYISVCVSMFVDLCMWNVYVCVFVW